ncbi:MAG: hypothetical protein PVSMB7_05850 [Chloroflexota bacterium]
MEKLVALRGHHVLAAHGSVENAWEIAARTTWYEAIGELILDYIIREERGEIIAGHALFEGGEIRAGESAVGRRILGHPGYSWVKV